MQPKKWWGSCERVGGWEPWTGPESPPQAGWSRAVITVHRGEEQHWVTCLENSVEYVNFCGTSEAP